MNNIKKIEAKVSPLSPSSSSFHFLSLTIAKIITSIPKAINPVLLEIPRKSKKLLNNSVSLSLSIY